MVLKSNNKNKSKRVSVYSNLVTKYKSRKDRKIRAEAQYRVNVPKNPFKKFIYYLNPKNFWSFWFSRRGAIFGLKIFGVALVIMLLITGGLFAYFRKDLDAIRPGEIAKRVQTTVNTYYDRNGQLLWEDKGDGNYKLVVDSKDISQYLKDATVAIEDQNFYSHNGVSISGLARAVVNNATGGEIQGGSTLTQQLVKQVFFADEAQNRGLSGIPRKIKELILSIEVERMYNKDQILTLYLNESPYGGRRNGAESGAQTYFGKSAKDLTIAEAALLASIPQNPSVYDPYNTFGHTGLISRQQQVIENMRSMGKITKEEAEAAKAVPIMDTIKPVSTQYDGIKAPHFVQMVREQLQEQLGVGVVGKGGLKITTSLDLRVQTKLEEAMNDMFASRVPINAGFTNGASTVEDVKTGQIVAMVGSRDFRYEGFGQDNAATAYIQPGSTIKPLVYSELFQQKPSGSMNYGSGSILKDENIDSIYGAKLFNADRSFKGDIPIRISLATSRNVPAVKAMYISGVEPTLKTIHELGGKSYCTQGVETQAGLSAAIGGCGIKQVDLVNGFASLARGGVAKDQSSVIEVKNNSNETLYKWTDNSKRVIDAQSAYIVSDILSDDNARSSLAGYRATGMYIPGVKTATKTGTSDKGGYAKDIWMVSYSPVLTMAVWLGNSDTTILRNGNSLLPGSIIAKVMSYAHTEVYAKDGKWTSGDWIPQPNGLQRVGNELYPSWWNKDQGQTNAKLKFDSVSKKKATNCTPDAAIVELDVKKYIDPITKKDAFISPDGYDASKDDDVHKCEDVKPSVSVSITPGSEVDTYTVTANVTKGTFNIKNVALYAGDTLLANLPAGSSYSFSGKLPTGATTVSATVTDEGLYSATSPKLNITSS